MAKCSIDGCSATAAARGWCHKHWSRWRTHGDPKKVTLIRGDDITRFWDKVDIQSPNGCWMWTGPKKFDGYGFFSFGRKTRVLAHRNAWVLFNGPIPKGEGHHGTVVMHLCDNPGCVNPTHLMLGSQKDNLRDMQAKGRKANVAKKGVDHHAARFTEDDIRYIRSSEKSGNQIAIEYGCHRGVINGIRRGVTWKHVDQNQIEVKHG